MKIVVTGTRGIPYIQGGVETHCKELYPRLVVMGCKVTIVRRSCYVNADNRISTYKGVHLHDMYAPRTKSLEAVVHTFLAVCYARKIKADIIHFHAAGPSILIPFARLLGLKVVMTYHGPDYERKKWGTTARFVIKLGERWGVKYAHQVIVISEVINHLIKSKYNRTDASLIYNGISTPAKSYSTGYLSDWGIRPQKYILAMGRFVPEKGFDGLIRAYALSGLKNKGIRLVLAGNADHEDPYSVSLKEQARREGIVLTGYIHGEKLNQLMSNAGLFVLSSFHEGLSIALLEAMSYELPVLASDIPANKEIGLSDDNYFPSGNWNVLAAKMIKQLNKNSLQRYDLSKYNWNYIAKEVYEVYKKIQPEKL